MVSRTAVRCCDASAGWVYQYHNHFRCKNFPESRNACFEKLSIGEYVTQNFSWHYSKGWMCNNRKTKGTTRRMWPGVLFFIAWYTQHLDLNCRITLPRVLNLSRGQWGERERGRERKSYLQKPYLITRHNLPIIFSWCCAEVYGEFVGGIFRFRSWSSSNDAFGFHPHTFWHTVKITAVKCGWDIL